MREVPLYDSVEVMYGPVGMAVVVGVRIATRPGVVPIGVEIVDVNGPVIVLEPV